MNRPSFRFGTKLLVAIVASTNAARIEAQFELHRNTIDGGGGMRSTGGDLELSGTIGQLDAGHLTGGDFHLSGGFWFGLSVGDCNRDGIVSTADHAEFADCMGGPLTAALDDQCARYDFNGDDAVNLRDFAIFQTVVNGD